MDNNLDASVRVYGLWNSKFASSGKTGLLKFYASYEFDKDGKIATQQEFYNAADLAIER